MCGARVTFLDANHCPGAAMLLFEVSVPACGDNLALPRTNCVAWAPVCTSMRGMPTCQVVWNPLQLCSRTATSGRPTLSRGATRRALLTSPSHVAPGTSGVQLADGVKHLHCGDMRYHKDMKLYPQLLQARGSIDKLYLDTTYCHPKHVFPTQQESIQQIGDAIAAVLEHGFHHVYPPASTHQTAGQAQAPSSVRAPHGSSEHESSAAAEQQEGASRIGNGASSPALAPCHDPAALPRDACQSDGSSTTELAQGCDEGCGDETRHGVGASDVADGAARSRGEAKWPWPCLVLLSAYKIGKERVLLDVARRTGCKIYVDERKMQVRPPRQVALGSHVLVAPCFCAPCVCAGVGDDDRWQSRVAASPGLRAQRACAGRHVGARA